MNFIAKWSLNLVVVLSSMSALASEYPTLETVDYVMTCMRLNGGQSVDNLYHCSCEIDVIARQLSFEDFNEARTFEIYKRMPGEKGGLFRESARADAIVAKLEAARADAKKRCFVGVKRRAKSTDGAPAQPVQ